MKKLEEIMSVYFDENTTSGKVTPHSYFETLDKLAALEQNPVI